MLRDTHRAEIAAWLEVAPDLLRAEPLRGVLTRSEKYLVHVAGEPWFVKVADPRNEPAEAAVLSAESQQYQALGRLGLTSRIFPRYRGFVSTPRTVALLIEYLRDTSWGGPWTRGTIERVERVLASVHRTSLPRHEARTIRATHTRLARALRAEEGSTFMDGKTQMALFERAWDRACSVIRNSRGQAIFAAREAAYDAIRQREKHSGRTRQQCLVVGDLNLGNIGIAADRAYLVDPAYLHVGDPAFDRTVLGVNILRVTPAEAAHDHDDVRRYVKDALAADGSVLAALTRYWVACTQLPYGDAPRNPWMDFQQDMAITALGLWSAPRVPGASPETR